MGRRRYRALAFPLLALVLWLSLPPAAAPPDVAAAGGSADPVRVRVQADSPHRVATLAAWLGVRYDFGPLGFTTDVPRSALAALQRLPGVRVTPVPVRRVGGRPVPVWARASRSPASAAARFLPDDPTPWGIEAVYGDPRLAAVPRSAGRGIVVAVLDTGVAPHPDLKPPRECVDFTLRALLPPRVGSCRDGHGHGTHVTGTILADGGQDGRGIYGVAPGADYFAYKVCSDLGTCFEDDVAAAIRRAVDRGARIVSLSLGGPEPGELERAAVRYAWSRGVLVVAAAGNEGPDPNTIAYPAAFPEVVAVAALREDLREVAAGDPPHWAGEPLAVTWFSSRGRRDDQPPEGSSKGTSGPCADALRTWTAGTAGSPLAGRCLEVAAPGLHVESTYLGGTYAYLSGTSMAAPHVTGLLARHWAANPGLRAADLRAWLQRRAAQYDVTRADQEEDGDQASPHARAGYDIASGFGFPRAR